MTRLGRSQTLMQWLYLLDTEPGVPIDHESLNAQANSHQDASPESLILCHIIGLMSESPAYRPNLQPSQHGCI